ATDTIAIAFTEYLGVDGIQGQDSGALQSPPQPWPAGDKSGILVNSGWDQARRINFASISDGSSNTLMVGERPPSADLFYGWWFAGAGYDGSGVGDVVLGAREYGYASAMSCPNTKVGLQPGKLTEPCDQIHFWSLHSGGANFLMGD